MRIERTLCQHLLENSPSLFGLSIQGFVRWADTKTHIFGEEIFFWSTRRLLYKEKISLFICFGNQRVHEKDSYEGKAWKKCWHREGFDWKRKIFTWGIWLANDNLLFFALRLFMSHMPFNFYPAIFSSWIQNMCCHYWTVMINILFTPICASVCRLRVSRVFTRMEKKSKSADVLS